MFRIDSAKLPLFLDRSRVRPDNCPTDRRQGLYSRQLVPAKFPNTVLPSAHHILLFRKVCFRIIPPEFYPLPIAANLYRR